MLLAVLLVLLILSLAAGIPVALGAIDILIKKYNAWLRKSRYRDVLLPWLVEPRKLLYLRRSGRIAALSALGWALMALGELVHAPWLYRVGVGYLVVCICLGVYYILTGKIPGPARFRSRAEQAMAPVKTRAAEAFAPVKRRAAAIFGPVAAKLGAVLRPVTARVGAVLGPVFRRIGTGVRGGFAWLGARLRPVGSGIRKAWNAVGDRVRPVWNAVRDRVRPVRMGVQSWLTARRRDAAAIWRKGVAYVHRLFHFRRKTGSESAPGDQLPDAGGCGGVLPAAPAAEGIHRPGEGQRESGGIHSGGADAP